ncbi:hypothetical protein L1987_15056 [Smallanthus sonchifolius]|uniref:Uncharacterized protein n=1 Tax=Smallanthus sonchifolius TaxID=185202 RepID=A0ACB9J733_9ASTR|nr:hypothetical protein L1987_15056 [Smallanthus sonchifolius]
MKAITSEVVPDSLEPRLLLPSAVLAQDKLVMSEIASNISELDPTPCKSLPRSNETRKSRSGLLKMNFLNRTKIKKSSLPIGVAEEEALYPRCLN